MFLFLRNAYKKKRFNSTEQLKQDINNLQTKLQNLYNKEKEAREIYNTLLDKYKMLLYLKEDSYTQEYIDTLLFGAKNFKDKALLKKAQEFLDSFYIKKEQREKIAELERLLTP